MDRLIDEIVTVKVKDALASATSTSVNTVAIVAPSTKQGAAVHVEYDIESVKADFDENSAMYKLADAFFREENNPGKLVCIPVQASSSDDENGEPTDAQYIAALNAAIVLGKDAKGRKIDFYHVIARKPEDETKEKIIAFASAIQDWCDENFKVAHVEMQDRTIAENVAGNFAESTLKRTFFYFHNEDNGRSLAAAIVANRCYDDPARGTWAHKSLTSVSSDSTSKDNLKDAQEKGLNIYCEVAGVNRLFFGSAAGGKHFIDEQIKKDWLKFRVQESIFNLLGQANNGDGIDYNDSGIDSVTAAVTDIFVTAVDQQHRYVLPDSFNVTAPKYADIDVEEKRVRNLPDVKATFSIQASIHTVKTVELQVIE
ncbi:MAG: DUF3383 family protein [Fibrobacter sp.]|nr:DUF3383 family protein [Fibrobacter sp.]